MSEAKRNDCKFIGNLTREPELRYTPNGYAVASFGLAVSNDYKKDDEWVKQPATFLDFTLWGDKAEEFVKEAQKGQRIIIKNSQALVRSWEDKASGMKRSKVEFKVWDYELVEREERDEKPAKKSPGRPKKPAPVEDNDGDDDVF